MNSISFKYLIKKCHYRHCTLLSISFVGSFEKLKEYAYSYTGKLDRDLAV